MLNQLESAAVEVLLTGETNCNVNAKIQNKKGRFKLICFRLIIVFWRKKINFLNYIFFNRPISSKFKITPNLFRKIDTQELF